MRSPVILFAAAVVAVACSEATIVQPGPPTFERGAVASLVSDTTIASDTLVSGRGAKVTVGVRALNGSGQGVANVKVLILVPDSDVYRPVVTDASGAARTTLTLDSTFVEGLVALGAGERVSATVASVDPIAWDGTGSYPTVVATAPSRRRRAALSIVSGNNQSLPAYTTSASMVAQVKDEFGVAVPDVVLDLSLMDSQGTSAWQALAPIIYVNATAASGAVTNTAGLVTIKAMPGGRLGANRLRLVAQPSTKYAITGDTFFTITQTMPASASLTLARYDSTNGAVNTGSWGICRRLPVRARVTVADPTHFGQVVEIMNAPVTYSITRPTTAASCPGTTQDKATTIADSLRPGTIPVILSAGAGANGIKATVGTLSATISVTGARFPMATYSDTVRTSVATAQTTPITITVVDTAGVAMSGLQYTTPSAGGLIAETDSTPVFWTVSPTTYITGPAGTFTVNSVKATKYVDPAFRMYFTPVGIPGASMVRVPVKIALPSGATFTFAATPATTVTSGSVFNVTVRARGPAPANTPVLGMDVTATRTAGPAAVQKIVAQVGLTGDAVFSIPLTTKGTYTFTFTSAYFAGSPLTATVTVP